MGSAIIAPIVAGPAVSIAARNSSASRAVYSASLSPGRAEAGQSGWLT